MRVLTRHTWPLDRNPRASHGPVGHEDGEPAWDLTPRACPVLASTAHTLLLRTPFQVWFQNRRAKFRRNERAMLANKNASLLKSYSGDVTAVEQPVVPRPAPRPTDYLSWGTASPYR